MVGVLFSGSVDVKDKVQVALITELQEVQRDGLRSHLPPLHRLTIGRSLHCSMSLFSDSKMRQVLHIFPAFRIVRLFCKKLITCYK